jgi:Ca-activated chloride channel family protein
VGVVAFAGTAAVVQAPTTSRDDVIAAIDRFQLQRATATGSGIILSLATLFPTTASRSSRSPASATMPGPLDEKKPTSRVHPGRAGQLHVGGDHHAHRRPAHHRPRPAGSRQDGGRARRARVHRGHRHHQAGETIGFEGWSMRVRLDEETLKNISVLTHGEYFYAGTAEDLKKVYRRPSQLAHGGGTKETEVSRPPVRARRRRCARCWHRAGQVEEPG